MSALAVAQGAALGLLVTGIVCGLVAWAGPLDRPRARGLHSGAVATSGGLAIIAGVSAGMWLGSFGSLGFPPGVAASLALASAMGLLGALDDLWDLDAKLKLAIQAGAALAFAALAARIEAIPLTGRFALALGPVLGALGTGLWIVVVFNAVNFMDGANGLAAGALAIAAAAFGIAALACGSGAVGVAALILAAAQLGLLPWNLSGRLFQGDVGSLFSSTFLAALAVVGASAPPETRVPIWTAPLALLPLLTDVLLTLLARARRRRPLLSAHREHLYQLWLSRTGQSHGALAWRVWAISGACGLAALAIQGRSPLTQLLAFTAAVALSAAAWVALRRRYDLPG